jgi:hypothetical protein
MYILLLIASMLLADLPDQRYLLINQQQITVSGNTSLGGFDCKYTKSKLQDTLVFDGSRKQKVMRFLIPVEEFSCGSFLINRDFKSTIKADEYPHAEVQVKNFRDENGYFKCDLSVNLVGKTLEFPDLALTKKSDGLVGKLNLSFDRLDLKAPKKLGGLIKVDETLELEVLLGF